MKKISAQQNIAVILSNDSSLQNACKCIQELTCQLKSSMTCRRLAIFAKSLLHFTV